MNAIGEPSGPNRALQEEIRRIARIPPAAGIFAVTVGVVVLLGWAVNSSTLKQISPSLASMKANTAIGLIAFGLALVLLRESASRRSQFAAGFWRSARRSWASRS